MPDNYFQSFRDMVVWQQAFDFAREAHALSLRLKDTDVRDIAGALQRASVAIPAQIAQGQRKEKKEFVKHLSYAMGHAAECETYLLLIESTVEDEAATCIRLRENLAIVQKMLAALSYALGHKDGKKEVLETV